MASLIFYTSNYATLSACDAAASTAGGTVVVDSNITLSTSVTIASKSVRFMGGQITLGSYALSMPTDTQADSYAWIFVQSSSGGQTTFQGQTLVYANWWGADPTGNAGNELQTYNAFQWAELAVDGQPGSIVSYAPGHYVLNAANAVFFRNSHHIAQPGTVRIDCDPTTVTNAGFPNNAIFQVGNPNTRSNNGQRNSSFIAYPTSSAACANCDFVGAYATTSVSTGLRWIGIDIIHDPTPQSGTFLGTGKFCFGLYANACFNILVKDSWFVGMANDGLVLWGCSGIVENCHFWFNGFYGGTASQSASRNGSTFSGWMDLLTPGFNTDRIRYVNCTAHGNANSGLAPGGCSNDTQVQGCTTCGNATIAYEFILYEGEDIKQWYPSAAVSTYDLMYVPGAASVSGSPPNLGGFVFQCTTAGMTSSAGTGPSGTVGQTGITDNTVIWQCIGTMPPNGRVPATYAIMNTVDDGAIPTSLEVPYLGQISCPTKFTGNGVNGQCHFVINAGNEKHFVMENVVARNFGYSTSTSTVAQINSNDGGSVYINGYEQDNCYYSSSAVGPLYMNLNAQTYWGGQTQNRSANNQARVTTRNLRFRNPTNEASWTGFVQISGNLASYDIDGVDADSSSIYYIVIIDHSNTASAALERGRIANLNSNGCFEQAIRLLWTNGGTVSDGIDIEDCRAFNCTANSTLASPTTGFLTLDGPSGGASVPMALRLRGNKVSYAGGASYPLGTDNINNNSIDLYARGNQFMTPGNGQGWVLLGSLSHPLTASVSVFTNIDADDNGLPGEKLGRSSATPTTGTWNAGDRNWRYSPSTSGTVCDVCTTSGSLTGQMSGCAVTIGNGLQTGTYTGTPPMPGEFINFASGPTGSYRIVYAFNGSIAFTTAANAAASAVSVSYNSSAAFTGLVLP